MTYAERICFKLRKKALVSLGKYGVLATLRASGWKCGKYFHILCFKNSGDAHLECCEILRPLCGGPLL